MQAGPTDASQRLPALLQLPAQPRSAGCNGVRLRLLVLMPPRADGRLLLPPAAAPGFAAPAVLH